MVLGGRNGSHGLVSALARRQLCRLWTHRSRATRRSAMPRCLCISAVSEDQFELLGRHVGQSIAKVVIRRGNTELAIAYDSSANDLAQIRRPAGVL